MAIRTAAPAAALPEPEHKPEAWAPDEGNTISTIRVMQVRDAYVAIEHPEGWTPKQLQAALTRRASDLVAAACWWEADQTTRITQVVIGTNAPDEPGAEPVTLTDADLAPAPPVAVVDAFTTEGA